MTAIANKLKMALTNIVEHGMQERTAFLRNVGAAGWTLSCAAQLFAISINPEIPSKEKKFLIPQEVVDGITNVTLFCLLTSKAGDLGKTLAAKGKILPHVLKDIANKIDIKAKSVDKAKIAMKKIINDNLSPQKAKAAFTEYEKTVKSSGLITSVLGSALAVSIVAPLVRNKIAAWYQGWHMHQEDSKTEQKQLNEHKLDINPKTMSELIYPAVNTNKYNFEKKTLSQTFGHNKTFSPQNNMRV